MRKELNLGCSNFKNMIEGDHYYVDKSLFIRDIIKSETSVMLVPRPRRFGKTLNLSMLRYYFDISQPENEKLFTNLKIWQCEDRVKKHRGKHPVIYLTFKDVKALNWESCFRMLQHSISEAYDAHYYLHTEKYLKGKEIEYFDRVAERKANVEDYENSIRNLCKYIYNYHKEQVIILIDEYDTPIHSGYNRFYDEVVLFMRNLLSGAFKDNDNLFKGVITGILRVSKESIFSGLNNLGVHSILDVELSEHFGFTEEETYQIYKDFEIKASFEQVRNWYNGYKFGKISNIYNPWSILNYSLRNESGFKPYWANTSSEDILQERLKGEDAEEIREILQKLISGECIEKTIHENFVFPELSVNKELIWTLFLFSGYLTINQAKDDDKYELKIPNSEIKKVFRDIVSRWLTMEVKLQSTLLYETIKQLTNNQLEKFEKGFQKIIGDTFSYFDTQGSPEKVYQAYTLGLLAIIGDSYIIKSNRESGEGRYDILMIPQDKSRFGIVFEIKQIKKKSKERVGEFTERINKTLELAKEQIEENEYYKELVEHKIENIIKLPIVFAGKIPHIFPKKKL